MKVAIFGSYNYGNYGDDLMGVMFAHRLKQLGVDPIVYCLDPALAKTYGIKTTRSLDALLSDVKFCVIGGGGLLTGKSNLSALDQEIESGYEAFALATQRYNCPVYPLSVGGDGRGKETPLPKGRYSIFSSPTCKLTTVRNQSDIGLMKHLGKEVVCYPDVLWSAPSYWNLTKHESVPGVLKIGVNLRDTSKHRAFVSALVFVSQLSQQKVEIHLIRSHLAQYPVNHEMMPHSRQPHLRSYTYSDPVETLAFLASLDVLVSQKLHLGLSALAMGVPFISYGGQGKTHTMLNSIGAERAIASNTKLATLNLARRLATTNVEDIRSLYDFSIFGKLSEQSRQHMSLLESIIQQHM